MNSDYQKHDRFLKAVFSNIDKAREYFQDHLPPELLEQLNLSSLKLSSNSFVSGKLKELFADIVFEVKLKSGETKAFAAILFEHKSNVSKFVTVQKGYYIFSALMEQIKSGVKNLMPVIPVLFYHGKQKWEYHTHRSLYKNLDNSILKYIPEFDYVFHNLQAMTDYEILAKKAQFWNSVSLMLKHAHDEGYLINRAAFLFSGFKAEDRNLLDPIIVYYFSLVKSKSNAMKAIDIMPEPIQGKARNAYEEFILEGMEKGIEKGKEIARKEQAINLYNLGVDLEIISKACGYSIDQLKEIINKAQ